MITVKQWKDLLSFEPINKDGLLDVDGTVKHIAVVRGKTPDEIEETIAVEDLLPELIACIHDVNALVYKKLDTMPKKKADE